MARVILILLLLCQPFYLCGETIGFREPGLLGAVEPGQPRVVIVRDPAATRQLAPQPDVVASMVSRGVTAFTGQTSAVAAWRSLVSVTQDVVGVKVYSPPGPASGTRPAVVAAVVRGLLDAGMPGSRIVIWDRRLEDLKAGGFSDLASSLGVRVAGAVDSGYDPDVIYANPYLGQLVFGDLEFGKADVSGEGNSNRSTGRNSHLSRLLTQELTRLINIAPLLNHNHAGVSGILYTVASAATDNFLRFESNPALLASAVPEIYGLTNIADRVAINIVDALIGQYEGRQRSLLHYSSTPNELRFGTDPVALDVLSIEELNRARHLAGVAMITNVFELYGNARLLELGSDDARRIEILRVD
ncbi:MAG: DUF362 domain-containing protein [Verrucomicrobiales bacterium]|nr:DUF362 domain-containing protein [Verrucomicrobiales bacterium]